MVVSDTGPLNYLIQIDQVGVLRHVFHDLAIPVEVAAELSHHRAPHRVRDWIAHPPSWLAVHDVAQTSRPLPEGRNRGEAAAISLALSVKADMILIDDRAAAAVALARGLAVLGTLGILVMAGRQGLVDLRSAITRLQATNFRAAPRLYAAVLTAIPGDK